MSYYIIDSNNKKFEIIKTDILSKSGGTAIIHNVQGTDDFVLKLYKDKKYAKKSEAKLNQFIKSFPSSELDSMTDLPIKIHQLAWPKNIVYEKGKPVGFIMPKINFKDTVQLNRIFSIKNRKAEKITEDITWRITVARNLADVYNILHKSGYYIVDTKPANIRTYKMVPGVCLLDCDGFKLKNSPFEGDMITPDYIAPESIGKPPSKLGREQDVFALSVLIFQLLNNGIHPFSGILKKNDTMPIQERIKNSGYAYGKVESRIQKPSPASIHDLFPNKLLQMFSRIFERGYRPEASEWVSLLDEIKKPSALGKCNKVGHRGFKKGCPTCTFEKIVKGDTSHQKKNRVTNSDDQKSYLSASQSGPWGPKTTPPISNVNKTSSTDNSSLKLLGGIAIAFILLLFFFNNSQENNYTSSSNNINQSSSNSQNLENNESCAYDANKCNNEQLCQKATLGNKWETRSYYLGHVNLAKQRGLSCGITTYSANQSNDNASCFKNPSVCNNQELCDKATFNGQAWDTNPKYKGHVKLAKQKGLSCGVRSYSVNQSVNSNELCNSNPNKCNNKQLCQKATLGDKWERRNFFQKHVKLAKQKGLGCGVYTPRNENTNLIDISSEWIIYNCDIESKSFQFNKTYFFNFRRWNDADLLFFGIEKKKFEFGKIANLQVDNKKKLYDLPVMTEYWKDGNKNHTFASIDLTFYKLLTKQLKEGYNLTIESNNKKINVNLNGFTFAYNRLKPRNECK